MLSPSSKFKGWRSLQSKLLNVDANFCDLSPQPSLIKLSWFALGPDFKAAVSLESNMRCLSSLGPPAAWSASCLHSSLTALGGAALVALPVLALMSEISIALSPLA